MTRWSHVSRAVVDRVISASVASGLDAKATAVALKAAYPFGQRAYWPYKAWLKAVKNGMRRIANGGRQPMACPACGAKPDDPCVEIGGELMVDGRHLARSAP